MVQKEGNPDRAFVRISLSSGGDTIIQKGETPWRDDSKGGGRKHESITQREKSLDTNGGEDMDA